MKWYGVLWRSMLTIALTSLAWLAWQSPLPAVQPPTVLTRLPASASVGRKTANASVQAGETAQPGSTSEQHLWRVVTHRVVSKEGISALGKRLVRMHLDPVSIHTTEDMIMHAFDDAVLFKSSQQARAMAKFWQQHDIETSVIKVTEGVYLLALGRYYQIRYAEELQQQLDRVGRKYRYQQRRVPIPVVRFTFPPGDKPQAEQLWKKLDITGVVLPVLMSESQFDKLYRADPK